MDQLKRRPTNSSSLTPLGFLDRAATVYGDCTSIVYNDSTYTWSQTHRRCLQLASSLSLLGIKRGHVVSVIAPNLPSMYELHFAVPMCGAVLNTINTRLNARTVSILLRHSESKLVFVDHLSRSLISEAISLFPPNTQTPLLVLITDDGVAAEPRSNSLPAVEFVNTYEALVRNGDPEFKWLRPISDWDPIVLNYTSGTTSKPKGVLHCHRGIFLVTVDCLIEWSVPKQPVYLWTVPMFHVNGWSFSWGMAAVGGTSICLRKFDAGTIYSLIRRHGVTHMCGAPVVLNMLSNAPDVEPLSKPVQILTGGAPPPAEVPLRIESIGFIVTHVYGLTETAGIVVSCAWKSQWNRLPATERARLKARQGVRTLGMTEVDVIDPDSGTSVKRDGMQLGEIVLQVGSIMLGYLKDEAGTSKSINDEGWFYTGDVGVIHPDGYLEIKDRSKDVIISGGENISSVEVESVLYTKPEVYEAAVVSRPDEVWGESPCAFVSLKPESKKPTEKEIIEFYRARMPHYMIPKTVVFMAELPTTSTGKVQKFVLKDMARALGSSRVSRM